jgi:Tfp pilus assembly protein PilF
MKKQMVFLGLIFLGLILLNCSEQPKKKGEPAKSSASQMGLKALQGAANKEAASKNDEGVSHLVQRHWDTAAGFFKEAIEADPNLAEAHFNLALSLHKTGKHGDATQHFKKAKELASGNSKIVNNKILKDHVK